MAFNLSFSNDYFAEINTFPTGNRSFLIKSEKNLALVCDYDGKVTYVDIYNSEFGYFKYGLSRPTSAFFDGEYIYIVDSMKKEVQKISNITKKIIKKIKLDKSPWNIKVINNKLYITAEESLYILDKNLNIKSSYKLSVNSPYIITQNKEVFIPMYDNYINNTFKTKLLFFIPNSNQYIPNQVNIKNPVDIIKVNNIFYVVSKFEGKLYKITKYSQKEVADFNGVTRNIELFNDYIIGHSMKGGIYYYNLKTGKTTKILEDIPIIDITVSPDKNYIYAISHINNKLYIIKNMKVYQELNVSSYPIDVISPDNNIILVLTTDNGQLHLIRRFE
ncbi:hypothetical protein OSSY52_11370 [Tepiditoga spiralis]|uniref:Uncharacterized protein n=1 Tax=Tepiditoga spiralis TaxID=2108365 RepID=A0A7G1G6L5_9BACT|nr:hypothetical protein [Tepiditoga spiralis]BBE30996.1 hypothetical protein OSSY52_11370 [Tepiditoga spiralis]